MLISWRFNDIFAELTVFTMLDSIVFLMIVVVGLSDRHDRSTVYCDRPILMSNQYRQLLVYQSRDECLSPILLVSGTLEPVLSFSKSAKFLLNASLPSILPFHYLLLFFSLSCNFLLFSNYRLLLFSESFRLFFSKDRRLLLQRKLLCLYDQLKPIMSSFFYDEQASFNHGYKD